MKEVNMTLNVKTMFEGAFDNCHIGCDSCDFTAYASTRYKDGKAVGFDVKVKCENAVLCEHMMDHLKGHVE